MLSTRDIQRKIRTVRNIQQICRAMKTVSSIKLRKAEERTITARPYADALRAMVRRLSRSGDAQHPLLEVRDVKRSGIIAISADKGLAGSYNTNVIREASRLAQSLRDPLMITIGRKVTDAFRQQHLALDTYISPLGNLPEFAMFAALADHVRDLYAQRLVDRVDLVYTQFGGRITVQQLLPILPESGEELTGEFVFEPNAAEIVDLLLPRYLRTLLFNAVLSSAAAEHAARVAAMSLATENAEEIIHTLTMDYNKSRQATITTELGDIVSAAEALR